MREKQIIKCWEKILSQISSRLSPQDCSTSSSVFEWKTEKLLRGFMSDMNFTFSISFYCSSPFFRPARKRRRKVQTLFSIFSPFTSLVAILPLNLFSQSATEDFQLKRTMLSCKVAVTTGVRSLLKFFEFFMSSPSLKE